VILVCVRQLRVLLQRAVEHATALALSTPYCDRDAALQAHKCLRLQLSHCVTQEEFDAIVRNKSTTHGGMLTRLVTAFETRDDVAPADGDVCAFAQACAAHRVVTQWLDLSTRSRGCLTSSTHCRVLQRQQCRYQTVLQHRLRRGVYARKCCFVVMHSCQFVATASGALCVPSHPTTMCRHARQRTRIV
jgi:hypothetical protein